MAGTQKLAAAPTPPYAGRMPNAPRTPLKNIRVEQEKWKTFGEAAKKVGSNRSELVNQFIDWFIGKPGTEVPARPREIEMGEQEDQAGDDSPASA